MGKYCNPHRKDSGTALSSKVLDWWRELRTNKLSSHDFKEEVQSFDQETYFLPAELPSGVKKMFKQANSSLVTRDEHLKVSHEYVKIGSATSSFVPRHG